MSKRKKRSFDEYRFDPKPDYTIYNKKWFNICKKCGRRQHMTTVDRFNGMLLLRCKVCGEYYEMVDSHYALYKK